MAQEHQEFDPYQILEVPQGSFNTAEIKKAYRNMAKIYHPDKAERSQQ